MIAETIKKGLTAVKLFAHPIFQNARRHFPEILVVTGSVSVIGGTVYACKATIKAKEILEEPVNVENDEDGREIATRKGVKVVASYLPAVGMVGGGVAMLISAKTIEHRRLTAALGAYSSLQCMFEEYRARVVEEHGEEFDRRIFSKEKYEKGYLLSENEEGKKSKKEKVLFKIREDEDPFHRIFDDCNCPHSWRDNLEENRFFLECQQKALNNKLKYTGRVFLNEVYDALGFDYLPIGQFIGWVSDDIEGSKDGYIDFGIDYSYLRQEIEDAQREQRNPEPSIWLNFNCDGEVWSNPMRKRYDV